MNPGIKKIGANILKSINGKGGNKNFSDYINNLFFINEHRNLIKSNKAENNFQDLLADARIKDKLKDLLLLAHQITNAFNMENSEYLLAQLIKKSCDLITNTQDIFHSMDINPEQKVEYLASLLLINAYQDRTCAEKIAIYLQRAFIPIAFITHESIGVIVAKTILASLASAVGGPLGFAIVLLVTMTFGIISITAVDILFKSWRIAVTEKMEFNFKTKFESIFTEIIEDKNFLVNFFTKIFLHSFTELTEPIKKIWKFIKKLIRFIAKLFHNKKLDIKDIISKIENNHQDKDNFNEKNSIGYFIYLFHKLSNVNLTDEQKKKIKDKIKNFFTTVDINNAKDIKEYIEQFKASLQNKKSFFHSCLKYTAYIVFVIFDLLCDAAGVALTAVIDPFELNQYLNYLEEGLEYVGSWVIGLLIIGIGLKINNVFANISQALDEKNLYMAKDSDISKNSANSINIKASIKDYIDVKVKRLKSSVIMQDLYQNKLEKYKKYHQAIRV